MTAPDLTPDDLAAMVRANQRMWDAAAECPRCNGSGELWDGHTCEHDTGAPVTATCPDCLGSGERKTA